MSARGAVYSGGIHLLLILLAIIGLPDFFKKELPPEPLVMAVEIIPVSEIRNLKPDIKVQKKKVAEPKKVKMKKDETPVPTDKPAPKPEPKPQKDNPVKMPTKDKPKPKPEKKPKEKPKLKKEEAKQLKDKLKKVKESEEKPKKKDTPKDQVTQKQKSISSEPFNNAAPVSRTEKDAIKRQFSKYWNVDLGSSEIVSVLLTLDVREDGYITNISFDKSRYKSDPKYRVWADRAIRAVKQTRQIKGLPPEKFKEWQKLEINFDPKEMM